MWFSGRKYKIILCICDRYYFMPSSLSHTLCNVQDFIANTSDNFSPRILHIPSNTWQGIQINFAWTWWCILNGIVSIRPHLTMRTNRTLCNWYRCISSIFLIGYLGSKQEGMISKCYHLSIFCTRKDIHIAGFNKIQTPKLQEVVTSTKRLLTKQNDLFSIDNIFIFRQSSSIRGSPQSHIRCMSHP